MDGHYESLSRSETRDTQSTSSGDQSSSTVPLLTPLEPDQPSQPLEITQDRKRIGWHLLVTTLLIVTLSAGLAIALLVWVTVIRGVPAVPGKSIFRGALEVGAFLVDEGTTTDPDSPQTASLLALSFSSVTTQVISLTAPWLVMMAAYCIVGLWLVEQEQPHPNDEKLPTAAQFGFLVTLCSTAGIVAICQTVKYLTVGAYKRQRQSAPRLFYLTIISVATIYSMTHLISAADLWLHLSSSTTTHDVTVPLPAFVSGSELQINYSQPLPPDVHLLGVTFNDSLCDIWAIAEPDYIEQGIPCLGGEIWSVDVFGVSTAGDLIAANISFTYSTIEPNPRLPISVITLHNESDLAVIVSTSDPLLTWTAPTYGLRTSCRDVTDECSMPRDQYNCSAIGYPFFPPPADPSGDFESSFLRFGNDSSSNPLTRPWQPEDPYNVQVGLVVQIEGANMVMMPPPLMMCSVEYFNLTLRHEPNQGFSVVDGTMIRSSDSFAGIMAGPLVSGNYLFRVVDNIEPLFAVDDTSDNLLAALNQELARVHLGVFAGSVVPAPALSVFQPRLISRYPIAPLLTYVSLLFAYAVLVLVIFAWASTIKSAVVRARDGRESTSLQLGQNLLTNSLTLVGLALPNTLRGVDEDSPLKKPIRMFGEDSEKRGDSISEEDGGAVRVSRLRLGIVDDGPKKGMVFGLRESKKDD